MEKKTRSMTRRRFLGTTGTTGGSLLILPGGTIRGENKPSDKLNIGFIGMGGQIQGHVSTSIHLGHNIVAFCDVDRQQTVNSLNHHGGKINDKPKAYTDYRELLEKEKTLDAVVIATPDHWHAPICKAAMAAGKHVYCEKPLTHTVAEARELQELCKKSKVVTQTGNQGSASAYLPSKE